SLPPCGVKTASIVVLLPARAVVETTAFMGMKILTFALIIMLLGFLCTKYRSTWLLCASKIPSTATVLLFFILDCAVIMPLLTVLIVFSIKSIAILLLCDQDLKPGIKTRRNTIFIRYF